MSFTSLKDYYSNVYSHEIDEEEEFEEKVCPPPITMPNGRTGYKCLGCYVFCAYVKANSDSGYTCADCRGWPGKSSI